MKLQLEIQGMDYIKIRFQGKRRVNARVYNFITMQFYYEGL